MSGTLRNKSKGCSNNGHPSIIKLAIATQTNYKETMKRNFTLRIKDKTRADLEKIAAREEESKGEIARRMIEDGIKRDKRKST